MQAVQQEQAGKACPAGKAYSIVLSTGSKQTPSDLKYSSSVRHETRLVQCRLPVGQHQIAIPQVAVHNLAIS